MNKLEAEYTSTNHKLFAHLDRLVHVKRNLFFPVELSIALTDKCNLHCKFCSVRDRKMDELDYLDLKKTLKKMVLLGLRSIVFTGGGDPTLHPKINQLIKFASRLRQYRVNSRHKGTTSIPVSLGIITNGLLMNKLIKPENLKKFTWIRISMNGLDEGADYNNITVPKKVDIGLSYVWTENSSEEKLTCIEYFARKWKAKFVRVVPNCLRPEDQQRYKKDVSPLIEKFPNFFFQTKPYYVPEKCWIGWLKPFLNSDGYFYPCSAIPLLKRYFDPKFRIGHMTEANKIWPAVKNSFPTHRCQDGKCFWFTQNNIITDIINSREAVHRDFI